MQPITRLPTGLAAMLAPAPPGHGATDVTGDIDIRADWRRFSYAAPFLICSSLVVVRGISLVIWWSGLRRVDASVFGGQAGLVLVALAYLLLLEIPRRRLVVTEAGITLQSWRSKRTVRWAEIDAIQPGFGGWLSINRQLPSAAILVLQNGVTQAIPDVFPLRRAVLVQILRHRHQANR